MSAPAVLEAPSERPTSILVVDDDAAARVALRRCLSAAGVAAVVDELVDLRELMPRLRRGSYDCVVIDHLFAGGAAVDVIARIRSARLAVAILGVADVDDEAGAALVAAGANDFLAKADLSPVRLARRLRFAIQLARVERDNAQAAAQYDRERRLLHAVVKQLPLGVAVVDGAMTKVHIANRAAEQVFGRSGAELVQPQRTGLAAHARRRLAATFDRERAAVRSRVVVHGQRSYRIGVAPIMDRDGVLTAGVIVVDDVTDASAAIAAGDRATRAYRETLTILSHDLDDPLRAIAAALPGLAVDRPGPHRTAALAATQAALGRTNRLLADLVTIDRIASGTFWIRPIRASVRDVLDQAVRDHTAAAATAGMTVTAALGPGPTHARFDPDHLLQSIGNLVLNAVRHARGSRSIELEARVAEQTLTISVRDHGPGLADDARARLFERAPARADGAGPGFGLTIVRAVAEAHRGTVTVSTTEGGGATFTLALPQ